MTPIRALFPNNIYRRARHNPATYHAVYTYNIPGGGTILMPGTIRNGRFIFENAAHETMFCRTPVKQPTHDTFGMTPVQIQASNTKRRAEKMAGFNRANPDIVMCADLEKRRIRYSALAKTSGSVRMRHNGKTVNVTGFVHNGGFLHNEQFNHLFPRAA